MPRSRLNFGARTPLAAVNVSLRSGREIVAAAAADPFSGEIFWTDGAAAWVRGRAGSDVPARPDTSSRIVDLNLDPPFLNQATFRAALLPLDEEFAARFRPRVLSTSLALAWVAAGRRAGYVTDGDLRDSVHFAAGIAVCAAAGVIVTGLAGQPVHTGVHGLVAAADADTHATLLACISRQRHASRSHPELRVRTIL